MRKGIRALPVLGIVLFIIGVLLGVAFSGSMTWAGVEAYLFDPALGSDEPLTTLRCPVIITTQEAGIVSATFSNPSERPVLRTIRLSVSYGFVTLMRKVEDKITLAPGETRRLEWTVYPEEAAWQRLVLIRVYALRNSPLPSRTSTCGILVVDTLRLTGNQIVVIAFSASLLIMADGMALWVMGKRPLDGRSLYMTRAMGVMGAIVLAAMCASLLHWWLASGLALLLVVLLSSSIAVWSVSPGARDF